MSPSAFAIFSFKPNGITVTEASMLASPAGTNFQIYAESSGAILSGVAIANPQSAPTLILLGSSGAGRIWYLTQDGAPLPGESLAQIS